MQTATATDYDASTLSVRDARKRFEQLSSSVAEAPATTPNKGDLPKPRARPPPPKPIKRLSADDAGQSSAPFRVQSPTKLQTDTATGNGSDTDASVTVTTDGSPKPKARSKKLKKTSSVLTGSALASSPTGSSTSSSRNIFKRRSLDKGKMDAATSPAASEGSTNGRTSTKNREGSRIFSSPKNSPSSRKKILPLSSTSSPSSPVKSPDRPPSFQRAFSNSVLVSGEERSVQASLKDESKGKVLSGSRPTSPRVIEDGELKLNLTEDISLSGAELKHILNKQLAYVSGGMENGHLILTFPDVGLKHLESSGDFKELMITIIYFKSLISINQLNIGFTLVLDAHSSKVQNIVKQLLDKAGSKDFPLSVHMVCMYVKSGLIAGMKAGIFGRNKTLASAEVCTKLHLATFNDLKSLAEQLGEDNLTPDLGGTLSYDHTKWVSNRLEFEKTQVLHRNAMTRVPDVMEALRACEVPNSVKNAEHLMQEDLKLKENLVNRIAEAELNIDRLLSVLAMSEDGNGTEESVEVGSVSGGQDYVSMKEALHGMLKDLKASQGQFDSFWTIHKARVDHMMRMCHYKRTAEELESMIREYIDDLTAGGVHLGDTLESALELGEKHEAFVTKCKTAVEDQIEKMREDSNVLTNPHFLSTTSESEDKIHEGTKKAVESVKVTMDLLNATHQQLITMCQQKRDLFIVCVKFHMTTRQCSQWNQDVLEFLASQPMESPSYKQANSLVGKIDDFLCRLQPSQIQSLQGLANALPGEKMFQRHVTKTAQKYEHSCELLNNRKTALLKVINSTASPCPGNKSKGKKSKHDKEKPDIEILNSIAEPVNGSFQSNAPATANPEASLYLAKTLVSETSDYADGENDEVTLKKRSYVYKELIATEEEYIKDLKIVINSYYDAMDDSDSLSMPLRLRGKREGVFGNLPEIYKFHDVVFKKALEQFEEHPEGIGECFVQFTEEFQMYSIYCKNRSNSETLLNESTESEAFFKGIQRRLAHQLPLNSYLLKPVQRITKYQLLIKDMMKHSMNSKKAHSDLQQALDRMLKVLKNLNDSLHVVGLKGFPGALAEQGRLLVHDAFQLWENSAARSLFSRGKPRHVFLFEKVLIFSKRIEAPVQKKANKSDNYLYKGHLQLAELILRETVDGQPLQFSLTLHGQHKDFRFQAHDKEIHTMWTSEIRRLLQVQFLLMKDMVIKSGTLDRRAYKGKTRRKDSRLFGDSFKERPSEIQSKKSISGRFKLLKKRKSGFADNKVKKESSLLASSSYPANVKYRLKDAPPTSPTSLTQSNIESTKSMDGDSMSSEDEFPFTEDEEDDVINGTSVDHYESLAPGAPRYYEAISAYSPDENGVALSLEQEVEVIGINQYGWWWVRATNPSNGEVEEGWVPASYLKVAGSKLKSWV